MVGLVRRARRQLLELRRDRDEAHRLRQLAAELVDLAQIEIEGRGGLPHQRVARDVVRDERIAVAVAADPGTQAQDRPDSDAGVRPPAFQRVLDFTVQPRQFAQEGVAIVGQPVFDLVTHGQLQLAQDTGLPQRQDRATQRFLVGIRLLRRQLDTVTLGEQARDLALAVEDALALHLGRMRGQHGRDQRIAKELRDRTRTVPRLYPDGTTPAPGFRPRPAHRQSNSPAGAD